MKHLILKVKVGKFSIPESFSDDLQDLIKRMLKINPSERITIEQIKQHPAFFIGLRRNCLIPTPILRFSFNEPILNYNPNAIKTIVNIGYQSEQQVIDEITSKVNTKSKVFYKMLCGELYDNLDLLPWKDNSDFKPSDSWFIHSPFSKPDAIDIYGDSLSPNLESIPDSELGLATTNASNTEVMSTITINTFFYLPEALITQIHTFLVERNYDVLYPDQYHMYSRTLINIIPFYLVFKVVFEDCGPLILEVAYSSNNFFDEYSSKIITELKSYLESI